MKNNINKITQLIESENHEVGFVKPTKVEQKEIALSWLKDQEQKLKDD